MTTLPTLEQHRVVLALRGADIDEDRAPSVVLAAVLLLLNATDPVTVNVVLDREPTQHDAEWIQRSFQRSGTLETGPDIELFGPGEVDRLGVLLEVPVFGDAQQDARSVALLTGLAKGFDTPQVASTASSATATPSEDQRIVMTARRRHDEQWSRTAGEIIRMVLLVQHPNTWGALAPIAAAGASHPRVDLNVVVSETSLSRGPSTVADFVRLQGHEPRDVNWFESHRASVDIVVVVDPYGEFRPESLRLAPLLESGIRLVYSPYAENIGGGPANLSAHYDAGLHRYAWRAFMPTREQVNLFADNCSTGGSAALCVGAVKGDWLLDLADDDPGRLRLERAVSGRPSVLWNPHFTTGDGGLSTFFDYAGVFVDHFEDHPDHVLIARPHFRLLPGLEAMGGAMAAEARTFRERCRRLGNVILDENPDYRPAMKTADVLISDLSSLIPEYGLLGKPTYLLERPGTAPTVADTSWRDAVEVVHDAPELYSVLRSVGRSESAAVSPWVRGAGARLVDVVVGDYVREVWNP